MPRLPLRPYWHDPAITDLQEHAARSSRSAERAVDEVKRMCRIGPTGHPWSMDPRVMYRGVRHTPLGIVYEVVDGWLHILAIVDARQLPQAP